MTPRALALVWGFAAIAWGAADRAAAEQATTAEEAAAIAREATVWGYPLVVMDRTRRVHLNPPAGRGTPVAPNNFRHIVSLADHTSRTVVMPNNDTLYSVAWLKLSEGPQVLYLPAVPDGRYVSFQLLDAWTNTVGYARPGRESSIFIIAGPNWRPELKAGPIGGSQFRSDLPASGTLLRSPTNMAWLLGRTLVDDPNVLGEPRRLQAQYRLSALTGLPLTPDAPQRLESPQNPTSRGIGFLDELAALLPDNPPPAADAPVLQRLARIGLVRGGKPAAWIGERGWTEQVTAAIAAAAAEIERAAADGGIGGAGTAGGWRVSTVGVYGQDYALRARVARSGLGALTADEALYFTLFRLPGGEPLVGTKAVTLRLDPKAMPRINGFWSLSLYGAADYFFIENPIARFAIGDRTPDVKRDADGTVTITISKEQPAEGPANWLPAPEGPWMLTFRVYLPGGSAEDYRKALPLPKPVQP